MSEGKGRLGSEGAREKGCWEEGRVEVRGKRLEGGRCRREMGEVEGRRRRRKGKWVEGRGTGR